MVEYNLKLLNKLFFVSNKVQEHTSLQINVTANISLVVSLAVHGQRIHQVELYLY